MGTFRKSSHTRTEHFNGEHRFEHWYRSNTVYFITSKTRDGAHVFRSDAAKAIFWDRFEHYTQRHGFVPWVTSLLDNHYHTVGYLHDGEQLGEMMRKIHGSVAKLVNDTLATRHLPFWRECGGRDYFDGCLRDERQCSGAYWYTLRQSVRHGVARDVGAYPHTRVGVELERGLRRALELGAFNGLSDVPYARYQHRRQK